MLNFKNLIKEVLLYENPTAPPPTSPSTTTEYNLYEVFFNAGGSSSSTPVFNMFNDKIIDNGLTSAFKTKYNFDFPSPKIVGEIFNGWANGYTRPTAVGFYDLGEFFPVISFMCDMIGEIEKASKGKGTVADIFKSDSIMKISETAAEGFRNGFIGQIQSAPTANPIDFVPGHYKAKANQVQLRKRYGDQYLSQLALEKHMGSSIKDVVFVFLEARKKARMASLPAGSVPDQGKAVLDVLLHPENFAGGKYAFSNKVSSDKIYTRAVHTDLLNIALRAKKFFEAEAESLEDPAKNDTPPYPKRDLKDPNDNLSGYKNKISKSPIEYEQFLNNSSIEPFVGPPDIETFAFHEETTGMSIPSAIGKGGYNLQNIKNAMNVNQAAKELYDSLSDFANYVREGEVSDVINMLKAGTKMANALTFGTGTQGGKRA